MNTQQLTQFEQNSPIKKIAKLQRLTSNSLAKPLAKLGLARGTLAFLMEVLCENQGLIQQDISRELAIDRAATARALHQLEQGGLIRREENERNRREKYVYATEKTQAMQKTILSILQQERTKLFRGFTADEERNALQMMDRMIENMRQL